MSIRDTWVESDALLIEGDTFRVRCRSTFSGTRRTDFTRALSAAVATGLLDGAVHVEVALTTLGELWASDGLLEAIAAVHNPTVQTLSLGALLGTPDEARIARAWPHVQRAFPALQHDARGCWRWATKPRLRLLHVGPHFASMTPNTVLTLEANGYGPWLMLRSPPPGGTEFDSLALRAAIDSSNIAEVGVSPLEDDDEVRVNGRVVKKETLMMHRDGAELRKGTIQWFPVNGDVFEVGGLTVRYEEDAGQGVYAQRETHAVLMGGHASSTTITLSAPPEPPPPDDEED